MKLIKKIIELMNDGENPRFKERLWIIITIIAEIICRRKLLK